MKTKEERKRWEEDGIQLLKAQQTLYFHDLRAGHESPLGFEMEERCSHIDGCSERG